MTRSLATYFVILTSAAILAGGCAKQGLVKKDEPIPPAAAATPATTVAGAPSTREAGLPKEPVADAAHEDRKPQESKAGAQVAAMDTVFFDLDSYALTPVARDTLAKNAGIMKRKGSMNVRVEGHCDERGSDEYNLALGEKRAKAALDYLVAMGVPASTVSFISYGKEKPADPGHDEAAWAKNRRDEFVIVSK
ncbi:MAG TPA: peptidoglycan-associated lipoprotein Pal [Geobacteraceae bacterium]